MSGVAERQYSDPADPESRETEGIPTLMDGCAAHPDSGYSNPLPLEDDRTFACISRGHFLISFNTPSEGNALSNPNGFGGWATDGSVSASIATVNGVPVPEPASAVWFAAGLLVLAGFRRRYAHSAQISARYRVRPGRQPGRVCTRYFLPGSLTISTAILRNPSFGFGAG